MLDYDELRKHFPKSQQRDIIDLDIICMQTPPGRSRRTRVRKVKPNHIPRPINSFMSYRAEKQSIIKKLCPTANHRDISKIVAKWWHSIDSAEKLIYVERAKSAKAIHNEKYPDYIFRPKSKTKKAKKIEKSNDPIDSNAARTKPFTKTVQSQHNFLVTPVMESPEYHQSNIHNFAENNYLNHQNMYYDEVLYQTKAEPHSDSTYWYSSVQSNDHYVAGLLSLAPPQTRANDYNSYGPTASPPMLPADAIETINPLATHLSYAHDAYSSAQNFGDGQFLSANLNANNYEFTPYSQAMSTPMLDFSHSSPSPIAPASAGTSDEEKTVKYPDCLFNDNLPTDLLSPSANNFNDFSCSSSIAYKLSLLDNLNYWNSSC